MRPPGVLVALIFIGVTRSREVKLCFSSFCVIYYFPFRVYVWFMEILNSTLGHVIILIVCGIAFLFIIFKPLFHSEPIGLPRMKNATPTPLRPLPKPDPKIQAIIDLERLLNAQALLKSTVQFGIREIELDVKYQQELDAVLRVEIAKRLQIIKPFEARN